MAQFIAYDPKVQVNGVTVMAIVNAFEIGKETRREILSKNGLKDIKPDGWYSHQKWLNAFKEISEIFGPNTLYMIGKAIPANAKFPPDIDSLEKALSSIDVAYHMNHTKGEIGNYELVEYDHKKRIAIMKCTNPYPSDFDRGIIMAMVIKFRPDDSINYDVKLDPTKETRLNGANSCTYIITW